MLKGFPPRGAEELLQYFEGVDRDYPGEHLRNGAEMCRRWQVLMTTLPTQADIDTFVARLEAEPNFGTGWLDLGMQFRHWALQQGFRV